MTLYICLIYNSTLGMTSTFLGLGLFYMNPLLNMDSRLNYKANALNIDSTLGYAYIS